MYIWERTEWPDFRWDAERLANPLANVRHEQGRLLGRMEALGFHLQEEAVLRTLTEDVVKTSEIEGEKLDAAQVRSSIARRLGMDIGGLTPTDREVEGIVELMLDATRMFYSPLTEERLLAWHASLFPEGGSGMKRIRAGAWRDDSGGPMQVVSGPIGMEYIHFIAPPAAQLDSEMSAFLDWFNSETDIDPVMKAGVAHLWFVTIHPFDDGNGRIARAVADMALARSEGSVQRFYSMSAQIQRERQNYYEILERIQKGGPDITSWLDWFLGCLSRAIERTGDTLSSVISRARFWEKHAGKSFNERQLKVLNRILEGFEGSLTSSKWARLAGCSQDTAYRDILDLLDQGVLRKNPGGGRSTSYSLETEGA